MLKPKTSIIKAFTLTELLVSMAVLGLIATLTLPHMFMSADRAKKRAVFKEAYQALQEAVHAAAMDGVADTRGVVDYFNAKKVCKGNSRDLGCTTSTHDSPAILNGTFRPQQWAGHGVVLHNGVSIFGFNAIEPGTPGGISQEDRVVIGLEDFTTQEYFRILISVSDVNGNTIGNWGGIHKVANAIRPGEITCVDQNCFDMFEQN